VNRISEIKFEVEDKIYAGSVGCNTLVYVIHFDNIALAIATTLIAGRVSCQYKHMRSLSIFKLKVVKDHRFDFLPCILQGLLLLNNHNTRKIGCPMTLCPSRFFQFLFTLSVSHEYIHLSYIV
jgi:hypothetical protein